MAPLPPAVDLTGVDLTTEVVQTRRLLRRPGRQDDPDVLRAHQDEEMQVARRAGFREAARVPPPSPARPSPTGTAGTAMRSLCGAPAGDLR